MPHDPKARVLIVDDDPDSIPMVARALGPEAVCTFAMSGPEALSRLATGAPPDLILLNVSMPEMDGYEVCRRLKTAPHTRDIPVVFVTASREIDSETTALEAGGADFIPKPINPPVLRLRVRSQLLLRQREQALQRLNTELERRVAERTRALSEALARAESANRAKSTLLSNLSHEIRTPLNSVIGLAGLLQRRETDAEKLRRLASLVEAAQGLNRVLGNLLEMSSLEANRLLLAPRDFRSDELRERLQRAIAPLAEAKRLELAIDLNALPSGMRGDPERLTQLLLELLDNAVKFTTQGTVSIRARVLGSAGGRLHLEFAVSDSGCGVPEEAQGRIFAPFHQADSSSTRTALGAGLGLAIARQLAGLMGGEIRLANTDAAGSTFVVDLWLDRAEEETA